MHGQCRDRLAGTQATLLSLGAGSSTDLFYVVCSLDVKFGVTLQTWIFFFFSEMNQTRWVSEFRAGA